MKRGSTVFEFLRDPSLVKLALSSNFFTGAGTDPAPLGSNVNYGLIDLVKGAADATCFQVPAGKTFTPVALYMRGVHPAAAGNTVLKAQFSTGAVSTTGQGAAPVGASYFYPYGSNTQNAGEGVLVGGVASERFEIFSPFRPLKTAPAADYISIYSPTSTFLPLINELILFGTLG